jgi:hypothetical protein
MDQQLQENVQQGHTYTISLKKQWQHDNSNLNGEVMAIWQALKEYNKPTKKFIVLCL